MASPIDWFNKNSLSKLWAKIDSLFARKTDIQTMIKAGTATNTVDETKSADSSYFRFMPYTDTENVAYKYIRLNMTGATTSDAGLMSATDKAKLNGIETGANKLPDGGTVGQFLKKVSGGLAWDNAIPLNTTAIDDANTWLTTGYTKTKGTTTNLPAECQTATDKWGILFFAAENEEMGTGTQMFFPIDGDVKGNVYTRSLTRVASGGSTIIGEWKRLATTVDVSDLVDEGIQDATSSLNLGGYENAKKFTVTDLNNLTTPGSYYGTTAGVSNAPYASDCAIDVILVNNLTDLVIQVFRALSESSETVDIRMRFTLSAGGWSSWKSIGGGSEVEQATDTTYGIVKFASDTDFKSYMGIE